MASDMRICIGLFFISDVLMFNITVFRTEACNHNKVFEKLFDKVGSG